jgi:hypothetical protein
LRERVEVLGLKRERDESVRAVQQVHLHFETLSFKLADRMKLTLVQKLFDDLSRGKFGSVARAKALVNTSTGPYRFDCSFGKVDMAFFEKVVRESRLVVIGEKLNAAEMQKAAPLVQIT